MRVTRGARPKPDVCWFRNGLPIGISPFAKSGGLDGLVVLNGCRLPAVRAILWMQSSDQLFPPRMHKFSHALWLYETKIMDPKAIKSRHRDAAVVQVHSE